MHFETPTADIYKPSNRSYYYADFVDPQGNRIRKSTKSSNAREARKRAQQMCEDAWKSVQFVGQKSYKIISLREVLQRYLREHRRNRDLKTYEGRVRTLLGEREGVKGLMDDPDRPIHELTQEMIDEYKISREDDNEVSPETVNKEWNCITKGLTLSRGCLLPQGLRFERAKPRVKARPFTDGEIDRLDAYLDPARERSTTGWAGASEDAAEMRQDTYDLFHMLLDTGARVSEVAWLTWDRVARDHSSILVIRGKTNSRDTLAMTARTKALLERRHARFGNYRYVFPGWRVNLRSKQFERCDRVQHSMGKPIRRAIAALDLNDPISVSQWGRRSARSLRDTFATRLARLNVPIQDIQVALGHTDIAMTRKYLDVVLSDVTKRVASVLDDHYAK